MGSSTVAGFAVLLVLSLACAESILAGRIPWLRFRAPAPAREPPLWGPPEILAALGIWFLAQVALGGLLVPLAEAGRFPKTAAVLVLQLVSTLVTAQFLYLVVRRNLGQPWSTVGFSRTPWANLGPTLALWASSTVPIAAVHLVWTRAIQLVTGESPPTQELVTLYGDLVERGDAASIVLLIVAGVVVAPVAEETLFRGFVYLPLRFRWGPLPAALVSSAAFALFHWSVGALLPLVILGVLLCRVVDRTGSVFPAMAFHAVFNGTTFVALFLPS